MTTALATTNGSTAIASYGDSRELSELAERFVQFFNIPEKDMQLPTVKTAALKAAQLTLRFGLTPGVHIYIVKRGGQYAAEESLEAWKDAASKHARLGKFLYDVQTRLMTPEEVKANTPAGDRYNKEDRGAWARVIRFDIAREYKAIGMEYDPAWSAGFWRKESYEKKEWDANARRMRGTGVWESDTVPNQRTPQDVATRRATRAALKNAFTLIQLDDMTEAQRFIAATYQMQRQAAPLLDEPSERDVFVHQDADDDGLWEDEQPAQWREVEPAPAPVAPATNGNGNGHDNPFIDADDEAGRIVATWTQPSDAYAWAVEIGACHGIPHARNAFERVVREEFNGKLTAKNAGMVYRAFFADRVAAALAQADVNEPLDVDMADVPELAH